MVFLIIISVAVLYFLPIWVAAFRNCEAMGGIVVVTFLLGWTLIGWVVALAWAFSGRVRVAGRQLTDAETQLALKLLAGTTLNNQGNQ